MKPNIETSQKVTSWANKYRDIGFCLRIVIAFMVRNLASSDYLGPGADVRDSSRDL